MKKIKSFFSDVTGNTDTQKLHEHSIKAFENVNTKLKTISKDHEALKTTMKEVQTDIADIKEEMAKGPSKGETAAKAVGALADSLKDNIDAFDKKGFTWGKVEAVSNIMGAVSGAMPPPIDVFGSATFGVISSVIDICNPQPSDLEVMSKEIKYQTMTLKSAISVQTKEIQQMLTEQGSDLIIAELVGAVKVASAHLFSTSFLASSAKLSPFKLQAIHDEIGSRIKFMGKVHQIIRRLSQEEKETRAHLKAALGQEQHAAAEKKQIEDDLKRMQKENLWKKRAKKMHWWEWVLPEALVVEGAEGVWAQHKKGLAVNKKKDEMDEKKEEISDEQKMIIQLKSMVNGLAAMRHRMISLYCNLALHHHYICRFVCLKNLKEDGMAYHPQGYKAVTTAQLNFDGPFVRMMAYDFLDEHLNKILPEAKAKDQRGELHPMVMELHPMVNAYLKILPEAKARINVENYYNLHGFYKGKEGYLSQTGGFCHHALLDGNDLPRMAWKFEQTEENVDEYYIFNKAGFKHKHYLVCSNPNNRIKCHPQLEVALLVTTTEVELTNDKVELTDKKNASKWHLIPNFDGGNYGFKIKRKDEAGIDRWLSDESGATQDHPPCHLYEDKFDASKYVLRITNFTD